MWRPLFGRSPGGAIELSQQKVESAERVLLTLRIVVCGRLVSLLKDEGPDRTYDRAVKATPKRYSVV